MAESKRGLGRGFDSLIPTAIIEEEFDVTAPVDKAGHRVSGDQVLQAPVGEIDPNPHQPRTEFNQEALEALAASIRVHGILQPLVTTKQGDRYELIAGERRLRAAKLAGLKTVPVIVRTFDEQEKLELALIENIQRAELNPIELATAYAKLVEEFNVRVGDLANRVGRNISSVSNCMRLLQLPIEVKRAIAEQIVGEGVGIGLLTAEPDMRLELFHMVLNHKWTVQKLLAYIRGLEASGGDKRKAASQISPTSPLTMKLSRYLGTKVTQQYNSKGGKLIIEFYSEAELERIFNAIRRD